MTERPYDVVLLGATGFTGGLTAGQLAERAPQGLRWGLAGRNRSKLEEVRERIAGEHPAAGKAGLLEADVDDPESLRELAESTRVLVTTVGPYATYGAGVVGACAEAGTDYADITGEPEFVDRTWLDHHERAVETGARLVHACGFDSMPHDLGAQYTVEQLPEGVPLSVRGYVNASGIASGGTLRSVVTGLSRIRGNVSAHRERRRAEGPEDGARRVSSEPQAPHRALDGYAVPFPTLDPMVVQRSARALERYGPDFSYGHYALVKRLPVLVGGVTGLALGGGALAAAAQVPPARDAILRGLDRWSGPSEEQIERGRFSVRFVGEGGGKRVVTEVSGGDPGYGETSKMLAEAALCLASDELPKTSGQVTTAVAMGPALRERLERAGIAFRVLEGGT